MGLLINSQTTAATSQPFRVDGKIGLIAVGLAGADEVQIQVEIEPGVFQNLTTNGKLTVAIPDMSIDTQSTFRVTKGITGGSVAVYSV